MIKSLNITTRDEYVRSRFVLLINLKNDLKQMKLNRKVFGSNNAIKMTNRKSQQEKYSEPERRFEQNKAARWTRTSKKERALLA